MTSTDSVGLVDAYHLIHVGSVEYRRRNARAQAWNHPAPRWATKGHRAHAVHCHDPDRSVPLAEVVCTAHQGPAGAGANEQYVELGNWRAIAGAVLR